MSNILNSISSFCENTNVRRVSLYLVAFMFLGLVYVLNILYPLCADDWGYSFIYNQANHHSEKIQNILDIFRSQYNHYLAWGGRSVVHFIAQFLLFIDIRIAKFLNSLAYVFLFLLIYSIINKGKKPDVGLFIVLNIIVWFIQPGFAFVVFWLVGSANYLWGMLLLLLFIYPYYLFYLKRSSNDSYIKCILFFLWGIISGWTNENAALAMIFLLIVLLVYLKITGVKIPKWALLGVVGACVGCAVMLLAPGNQERAALVAGNLGLTEVSAFKLFKIRLYNLYNAGGLRMMIFSVIYALFLFMYLKMNDAKKNLDIIFLSLAFFVSGIVAFVVLFPVPYFPRDAWTSIHIFLLIGIGLLYVNIPLNKYLIYFRLSVVGVLTVLFINYYIVLYKDVNYISVKMKEREVFVYQEIAKGKKDIVVPEKIIVPKGSLFGDPLSDDKGVWTNVLYANYLGVNSIRLKKADE